MLQCGKIPESKILTITDLKTHFYTSRGIIPAVDGISLSMRSSSVLGLVGESGCGKSISALSILRLIPSPPGKIVNGHIEFNGRDLLKMTRKELHSIRGNEISMIFQEPMTSLNPVYTVGRQVMEILELHQKMDKKTAREKAIDMFEQVGIPEAAKRISCYPHQLSGGLRQRVMIAMALSCRPKLLIADEPTTALDVTVQAQILQLMRKLQQEMQSAILLITHDLGVVAEMCDEVAVMYAGKIMEQTDVETLFAKPLHPYTLGLLNSIPKLYQDADYLYSIKGMVPNLLALPAGCKFYPRCDFASDLCKTKEPDLIESAPGHFVRCWCPGSGSGV